KTMLRHFESVLLALADRGHVVRIASHRSPEIPPPPALVAHPHIAFITSPGRRGDEWSTPIHELRALRDYIRFLDRRFKSATKLRARALRTAVKAVTHDERAHLVHRCPKCDARLVDDDVGQMLRGFGKRGVKNLDKLLALMERTIPSATVLEDFLKAEQPDLVLVSPLVNLGSYQADFVKSAKALHIPVVYPVFSWDNLSTKGLIHVQPDGVIVWNERQRTEAVEMHGVPPERVAVTGAPRFDEFFAMSPGTTREQFCAIHGLDASQPIVVYLCSSEFVAGGEVDFVRRWIDEVRRAPSLRSCNILIRPHPRQQKPWKAFEPPDARVAVALPRAMNADPTLLDTVHHSAAVVGLNTSAQLEAGILGRPVLTILAPEFEEGQQGTLHFSYLLKEHGGFVDMAPDFEVHRRQLAAAVAGDYDRQAIRSFIEQFLRPNGIDRPATPFMVRAIEEFAHSAYRDQPSEVTQTHS
ncbi:MAG TPA: hypothetical protein VIZ32_04375, partial [Vicinamibacterales bacterium]